MKITPLVRTVLLLLSSCIIALSLSACARNKQAPLATVSSVDLARYQGKWYEVALLPNRFQAMCVADTQAEYRPKGEAIEVINRCRKIDGSIEIAEGIAKVVPASGNSKLRVSFFRPFYGNYWILDLDPNYQWVLVGEPGRKYGWVLSRKAVLPAAKLNTILDKAASLGYQRSDFHLSPQTTPLD